MSDAMLPDYREIIEIKNEKAARAAFSRWLHEITELPDLWETLAGSGKPIVLYGTGNGADKLIDALAAYGVTPAGVFASDGFVRERTFRGMKVRSYSEVRERYGTDMIVAAAFGTALPDVMSRLDALARETALVYPDLPLFADDPAGELFTRSFARSHAEELEAAFGLLSDAGSRALYLEMILYRLTGSIGLLQRTECFRDTLGLLPSEEIRSALDGGAFTGDTARAMLSAFPNLTDLVAAEPDARSFRRLSAFTEETNGRMTAVRCALGAAEGTASIRAAGSRGTGLASASKRAKEETIDVLTVDGLFFDRRLDLLKLDVEGAEADALRGADGVLMRDAPVLIVSVYHHTADLFGIPLATAQKYPAYRRFRLRRAKCYPAWDVVLLAERG